MVPALWSAVCGRQASASVALAQNLGRGSRVCLDGLWLPRSVRFWAVVVVPALVQRSVVAMLPRALWLRQCILRGQSIVAVVPASFGAVCGRQAILGDWGQRSACRYLWRYRTDMLTVHVAL